MPLLYFGGFRNIDDFHFLRSYSLQELTQSWYSNWNFTGIEANAYRPLAVMTNHMMYSLLGYNDVFFMMVIIAVNSIFALCVYHLSLKFLSKPFAFIASLIAILLPQTLFHSTWSTEIYAKIAFIFAVLSFDFMVSWYEKGRIHYLTYAFFFSLASSLYKEIGYSMFLVIPTTVAIKSFFSGNFAKKTLKNPFVWISIGTLFLIVCIRQYSMKVFPERYNNNYPAFEIQLNLDFFSKKAKQYTEYKNVSLDIFQPVYDSLPIKKINDSSIMSILLIVLFTFYVISLFRKKHGKMLVLVSAIFTSIIPLLFAPMHRTRLLYNSLFLILLLGILESVIKQKKYVIVRRLITFFLFFFIGLFIVKVWNYTVTTNNKYSKLWFYQCQFGFGCEIEGYTSRWKTIYKTYHLETQKQYAITMIERIKLHPNQIEYNWPKWLSLPFFDSPNN